MELNSEDEAGRRREEDGPDSIEEREGDLSESSCTQIVRMQSFFNPAQSRSKSHPPDSPAAGSRLLLAAVVAIF
jgi:hypothetical protein